MEIRNMLVETGGKVILVTKWQRMCLNCDLFFWKVELTSYETGEVSKQSVGGAARLFILLIVK